MTRRIFALVDCNNFYVSCERVFSGLIRERPVAVLSNNDGCFVAISNEAKALGIKRGMPLFQCQELVEQHHITLFSSNYSLYADLSERIVKLLALFSPHLEVYSIDEAFLDISHVPPESLLLFGYHLRETLLNYLGVPVSVGIATTKTLSKLAADLAKKTPESQGVCSLAYLPEQALDELLTQVSVDDVWGIGPKSALRLLQIGILSAKDLKYAPLPWVHKHLKVVGARTVLELQGTSCIPLETHPKPKQGIMTAKSFGRPIERLEELEEAVATYTARATEKLRSQGSTASKISVFILTNYFKKDQPQYASGATRTLLFPTSFTPDFLQVALEIVRAVYKPGYHYKKAGVFLSHILPEQVIQPDLFGAFSWDDWHKHLSLMRAVDIINAFYGSNTIFFGAQGIHPTWKMKQERRSPRYTTQWRELLSVT